MLLVSDFLFIQYEITDQVCWRQAPANLKKKPRNLNAKKHFGEKKKPLELQEEVVYEDVWSTASVPQEQQRKGM